MAGRMGRRRGDLYFPEAGLDVDVLDLMLCLVPILELEVVSSFLLPVTYIYFFWAFNCVRPLARPSSFYNPGEGSLTTKNFLRRLSIEESYKRVNLSW